MEKKGLNLGLPLQAHSLVGRLLAISEHRYTRPGRHPGAPVPVLFQLSLVVVTLL